MFYPMLEVFLALFEVYVFVLATDDFKRCSINEYAS